MYAGRGFPGDLLGIFLRRFTCPVSGQLEKNAFRTSLIPSRLSPAESTSRRPIFRDTQSRQVSADAPRHALIKCGVDSPGIRSQNRSPQFTPHFIVLGISLNSSQSIINPSLCLPKTSKLPNSTSSPALPRTITWMSGSKRLRSFSSLAT
jgi:hypothetical protein